MKSDTNIFLFTTIRYLAIKNSKCVKMYSGNPLSLTFSKVNGYFEEINQNKHLRLVPTNESKAKNKKYPEVWIETSYLIRSITKNPNDYDEKYMKKKFNSHNELSLNKTIEIRTMKIVVRVVFKEIINIIHKFP